MLPAFTDKSSSVPTAIQRFPRDWLPGTVLIVHAILSTAYPTIQASSRPPKSAIETLALYSLVSSPILSRQIHRCFEALMEVRQTMMLRRESTGEFAVLKNYQARGFANRLALALNWPQNF